MRFSSVTSQPAFSFKALYNMFFNKEAVKTHEKYRRLHYFLSFG
ncbi:hypothetical protein THOG11_30329 [Vibrio harveyi]|nr:hypothetical protein TH15OA1_540027 [Vibrio harveyi]CAH1572957.1 hypothetical protein THOG11_30329 [Vibrio harveyi]CAH1586455.1 hypothetical protein THOD03_90207 [Vibrio harveyi]